MVKRERHVVKEKLPQHTPFHFLSVSSKIVVFRSLNQTRNHFKTAVEVIPQEPPEGDHMANGRVEMAVRDSEFQLNKTQACASQMTVR